MAEQGEDLYEKYVRILYPTYDSMSDRRKDDLEMRTMGLRGRLPAIDKLFNEMKDPKSTLYRTGAGDKDLVEIADIYAGIIQDSEKPIQVPTGKVLRGGPYYDIPEDEYKLQDSSDTDVMHFIEMAVDRYNSKPKIRMMNIIGIGKNQEITKENVLEAKRILDEMRNKKEDKARPWQILKS